MYISSPECKIMLRFPFLVDKRFFEFIMGCRKNTRRMVSSKRNNAYRDSGSCQHEAVE
jgi:hypothetical protein